MTAGSGETVVDTARWPKASPRLSVLIPFFRDDPGRLLRALVPQLASLNDAVEVVVLDDGSGDASLSRRAAEMVEALPAPARFVGLPRNVGRSVGRNRLAAEARGEHLLFLDSDMLPDEVSFLPRWLAAAERRAAVVFGGFSLKQAPADRRFALHRAVASRSDCAPATVRVLTPEKYVFTSNLLVRRDVFQAERFDAGFAGWGWEDVEWGLRVSRRWPVEHIDNPATHMGLDTAAGLTAKAEQSAGNFARVVAAHGERVAEYPSYRAARALKRVPGRAALRRLFRIAVLSETLPAKARSLALRLYRASLYAEVV